MLNQLQVGCKRMRDRVHRNNQYQMGCTPTMNLIGWVCDVSIGGYQEKSSQKAL
jgi:hypothetical protein